jgi:hypothetical protein
VRVRECGLAGNPHRPQLTCCGAAGVAPKAGFAPKPK